MISANDLKAGMVVRWKEDLYQIISCQHVKMQQRAPIVKTKIMRLSTGAAMESSFRASDEFEEAYLERKEIQYLYRDGSAYHFMDVADYHDVTVDEKVIGPKTQYMKENATLTGFCCDGRFITVELPAAVELKVTGTEPGIRGDTAKGGSKPAQLETGAVVRVPLFVRVGDTIKVDTRTGEYIARA